MKQEYIWEVKVKNTPLIKRKCNHCNCDRFYCSNKFRMNSQKRNIDIWLIYRCTKCDSTYNLAILSHTKPKAIKKDLFRKFSENDEAISWEYAFSSETARKNNIELDYGSVEYEILYDNISINNILSSNDKTLTFKIKIDFKFGLKLSSVIKTCLGLSTNQINQMIEAKEIFTLQNHSLKKHKVKNGDTILISKEKLQSIYVTNI